MTIKQNSVFLANTDGTLIKVLDILSKGGIQIIASTVADTKDYGIYRILSDDPAKAYELLRGAGINSQLSSVYAISIDDTPGRAAEAVNAISTGGIGIHYLYSFLWKGKGVLVIRVGDEEKFEEVATQSHLQLLSQDDFEQ